MACWSSTADRECVSAREDKKGHHPADLNSHMCGMAGNKDETTW